MLVLMPGEASFGEALAGGSRRQGLENDWCFRRICIRGPEALSKDVCQQHPERALPRKHQPRILYPSPREKILPALLCPYHFPSGIPESPRQPCWCDLQLMLKKQACRGQVVCAQLHLGSGEASGYGFLPT